MVENGAFKTLVKCTVTRSYSVCVKLKSGLGRTAYVHLAFLRRSVAIERVKTARHVYVVNMASSKDAMATDTTSI